MNDAPRRTLRELIGRHGPGLCSDARRCEGLLRDLCGEHRREINILVAALRERVPLDLLAARNSVPSGLLLTRLAKRLEDHLALTEGASRWAVDSWALALGVVSDAELGEINRRRDEAAVKRVEAAETPAPQRPTKGGAAAERPGANPGARPPVAPPRPLPTPTPSGSQPAWPQSPPNVSPRQPTQGGSTVAARQSPAAQPPGSHGPANKGGLQTPSADPDPSGGRRGRWRGCLVGCFLLILLSALLVLGAPYVLNILREEQQQRSLEPPPAQTR